MDVDDGGREQEMKRSKRGVKRHADESNLSDDQRFTKRFNLLSLDTDRNGNAYIPLLQDHAVESSNGMQVDDTRDRVYIGDLDAEIADIEAHEPRERLVFLPDIEKHFSRMPQHVLTGTINPAHPDEQQLVLYELPRSLIDDDTVQISTRKAILEARHRAQDKMKAVYEGRELGESRGTSTSSARRSEDEHHTNHGYDDGDAMDII